MYHLLYVLFFHFPYRYATSDYDNVFAIFRTKHRIMSLWHAVIERNNKIKFYVVYNTYLYIDAVWLLLIINTLHVHESEVKSIMEP